MAYSVGKAIRQLNKEIDNIYFLSGDDYFLQKFFITNLNKKFQTGYSPRYFNFEEDEDVKIFLEEISGISLFSKKDIFIIRNLSRISKNNKDEILAYINNPKDDLITDIKTKFGSMGVDFAKEEIFAIETGDHFS